LIFENSTPKNPKLRGRTALFNKCFYSEAPPQTDEPVGPEALEGLVVRLLGAVSGAILDVRSWINQKNPFIFSIPTCPAKLFAKAVQADTRIQH